VAGSSGFLEIAVNQDSAARLLGLGVGTRVQLNLE
jgi:S-adenosylmethionine hydrolase